MVRLVFDRNVVTKESRVHKGPMNKAGSRNCDELTVFGFLAKEFTEGPVLCPSPILVLCTRDVHRRQLSVWYAGFG